jgi:hypothetical protein
LSEHAFRSFVTSASRLEMAGRGSNARSDARQPSRDGKRDDDGDFSQRDARAAEQNGGSRRSEKGASAAQLLVQL